jgi:DNA-binding SARP family transcriptional activator
MVGELCVRRDGVVCALPQSRKTRALLAYLAGTARSHRRERLCDLLWDVTEDPRGALRWSLSKIRGLVDDADARRIHADRETVEFLANGARIDIADLTNLLGPGPAALDTATVRAAATWFRGEFLEGLDLPDFHAYQAWCIAERERARTLHLAVLETLVRRLESDPAAALGPARERVRVDPMSESARADLIRLLTAAGRMHEAEQHYQAAGRLFAELAHRSTGELLAVWRAVRVSAQAPARPAPSAARAAFRADQTMPGPRLDDLNCVGRERERARATQALTLAAESSGARALVLIGEPGIGKSRLLRQMVDDARAAGNHVFAGAGTEMYAEQPYSAWTRALRGVDRQEVPPPLLGILAPILDGRHAPGTDGHDREHMHDAVVQWLETCASSSAGVLVAFDDAHWLDDSSVALLRHVLQRVRAAVLVALAMSADAATGNGALKHALTALRREQRVETLELDALTAGHIESLAEALGVRTQAARIHRDSGGNPQLAIELARALQHGGEIAPTLVQLIEDRLARLSPEAADLARWSSTCATRIDPQRLATIVSMAPADLDAALAELETHAVLRPDGSSGRYEFVHAIDQRVLYKGISDPRRRLMHRRLAEVLGATGASAFEVAHHAGLAGDAAAAARACVEAAHRCLRVCANLDALRFARRGMRYAERVEGGEQVKLRLELANVYLLARRPDDLARAAARIEPLAEQALESGFLEHARLGFKMLAWLRWEGGAWRDAQDGLRALEAVGRSGEPLERAAALGETARCLAILERDLPHAEALLMEARALAAREGVELACIADASGMLTGYRGEVEPAMRDFENARNLWRNAGDRHGEFVAVYHLILGEMVCGRLPRARELCGELQSLGERVREGSEAPFATALAAVVDYGLGDTGAQLRLESALAALRLADAKHRLAFVLTRAAEFELRAGEAKLAFGHAAEALASLEVVGGRPSEAALARATIARAAHELGNATAAQTAISALRAVNPANLAAYARPALEQALALVESGVAAATPVRTRRK